MPHFYQIYGLCIESDTPLPPLAASASIESETPDLCIQLDPQAPRPPVLAQLNWLPYSRGQTSETAYQTYIAYTPNDTYFRLHYAYGKRYQTYILNGCGSAIWVESNPYWSEELFTYEVVQSLLLGRMLGILLRLRGLVCLHGNTVVAGAKAFALLGTSGAGKSTLTASLLALRCALLSEDRVVLCLEGDTFWAQPGATRLRLAPDTLATFQLDARALERVNSYEDKWYVPLAQGIPNARIQAAAMPLSAIYLLVPREKELREPRLQALSTVPALPELLRQRFAAFELPHSQAADEYTRVARLAQQLPVRMVHRPDDLRALSETARLILNDVEACR
jgi:hypothetical protein